MVVVYRCRNCGRVLYVRLMTGQDSYGVKTPTELMRIFGGRCPYCGAKLSRPRIDDVKAERLTCQRLEELKRELDRDVMADARDYALKVYENLWKRMCRRY